jgi:hypothetical protein
MTVVTTSGPLVRAYRILKKMRRFDWWYEVTSASKPVDLPIEVGESALGSYVNSPGSLSDTVVVTDRALLVRRGATWGRTVYSRMASAAVEGPSDDPHGLVIRLKDGAAISVPIRRGRGRFRDAWVFLRFVDRVISDLNKE